MSDAIFKDKYKKLNKAQREAVDTIDGPVMVIAGPGTGKTTILTLRIANILKQTDTPPSGILALTFTEAGVKAMKMKLRDIIGSRADEVRVHTFHGFASSVISEFSEHFIHLSRSKQITDVEAESLLREILKSKKYSKLRPLGDTDFYIYKILGAISESKKEAWTPEVVSKFAKDEMERIRRDEDSVSTRGASKGSLKADALKRIEKCERTVLFSEVYRDYEEKKKEEKKMDFDDLLFELVQALKTDKLLLQLLQEKFLYILVDEHQDTNDSQNMIATLLSSFFETPNIFVVGDEKQAIYRFQGASVENFLKFQNIWKDMKLISLEENYRSHQDILDATFGMIETNYSSDEHKNLRVKLRSGLKSKSKPIDLVFSENTTAGDEYLVRELKIISDNEPDATVAVILRWNSDVDYVLSLCETNNIPVQAERGADIFSHPLGLMYFNILEYINDPTQTHSLAETIASGLWGLNISESTELLKSIKSGRLESIEIRIPALKEIKDNQFKLGPISFLIQVGQLSNLTIQDKLTDPISVEVWRSIIDLSKQIAVSERIENSSDLIKKLLDYRKTAENKTIKIGSGSVASKIQIMTAHSSKGLEYDYVFIPYSTEEFWIRKPIGSFFVLPREKDNSDEEKDARRLFYVAITRAKKHAVIIIPGSDDLGREFIPLRFVSELDYKSVKHINIPKVVITPKAINSKALSKSKRQELIDYSRRVLLENGLSVTALNHFIKCPSEFLFKSILKVPEPPSPKSEGGIAMHKAISEVWKSGVKTVDQINTVMDESIRVYFDNSFLSLGEKEIVLEELLKNSLAVSSALHNHFNLSGIVSNEKWVEFKFNQNKNAEIMLHGQLDTIIDTDDKVLVFDYKTREGMTENAIKGLTKNEDGGYWRQLIFYKILLQNNPRYADKSIEPALIFIKPDQKGRCPEVFLDINQSDIESLLEEVNNLIDSVVSGGFIDEVCSDRECKYCKIKQIL